MPGKVQIHQAERSTARPALMINPQLMIEDDARIAGAEARAGLHEFAAAERDEFPAHEPRDAWPGDGGDGDDLARDRG